MLNLKSLNGTTTEGIFHAVENCSCENKMDLKILSKISTDEAPAMICREKRAIKY